MVTGEYILKAKANYPQIIKASVMKIDQHIIVTLITNTHFNILITKLSIFVCSYGNSCHVPGEI